MRDPARRQPGRHQRSTADCHKGTIVRCDRPVDQRIGGTRSIPAGHNGDVPTTLEPTTVQEPDVDEHVEADRPWIVIVWNDPVNLMSYVTFVLQKLFGFSNEKATALMLDVHHKGRAVVANDTRERAEMHVFRLHEHGLWATMEKDGPSS
jgi:ATP-dependent Clp protease adaptor protein ClpS